MINECSVRRIYKCRCNHFIMLGLTVSISTCVYVFGLVLLSTVHTSEQRSSLHIDQEWDIDSPGDTGVRYHRQGSADGARDWVYEGDTRVQKTRYDDTEFDIKNKTKRLPHAIIIGVKKAGTRALLEYLRLHPNIKAPGPEPHFFDKNYEKGLNWYRDLMPATYKGQLTIEKTPSYFVTKGMPERVYRMSKKTKLIVVFRDPVTRALSDYAQLASRNPSVKSFEELVFKDNKTKQIDTSWTIVKIGVYAQHLARWLDYFPMNQIHFVSGEKLIENPGEEMKTIQQFLGLEQQITPENFTFNHTKGFPCYRRDRLKHSWHCLNEDKGRRHPDISATTRKRLQDFYTPFNYKLYSMTGRDFGWS